MASKDQDAKSTKKAPEVGAADDTAGGANDTADRQDMRRRRDEARAAGDTKTADELHSQLYN